MIMYVWVDERFKEGRSWFGKKKVYFFVMF